jgi:hypothetical protein
MRKFFNNFDCLSKLVEKLVQLWWVKIKNLQ